MLYLNACLLATNLYGFRFTSTEAIIKRNMLARNICTYVWYTQRQSTLAIKDHDPELTIADIPAASEIRPSIAPAIL